MLRDGTRFRINGGRVDWMRDRNGNKLTFGYDSNNRVETITDSLNRVVSISRNTGPGTFDQITYKGFGGALRIIKVNYSSLASALRSDYPSTLTYRALFPDLDGSTTTLSDKSNFMYGITYSAGSRSGSGFNESLSVSNDGYTVDRLRVEWFFVLSRN